LARLGAGDAAGAVAGGSGASVDRLAAPAVSAGVAEGSTGGGWRRSAMGLRDAQPEKLTQRTQRTQRTLRAKNGVREKREGQRSCARKTRLRESEWTKINSGGLFKAGPAS